MRYPIFATAIVLAVVSATSQASGLNFNTDTCRYDYSTPYDVDVTAAGVSYHRKDGSPARVLIHDGSLQVDGRNVAVSVADAVALRRYEDGVRRLMPEVATVAREAIQLGFSAMSTVTVTFAEGEQRAGIIEKLKRKQADALRDIDTGIGAGHFSHDAMEETIGGSVSDTVGELVGSVTSSAVTAALSGDTTRVAALQARAGSLEKSLDREMDAQSKKLHAHSDQLCPRLNELADIQRSLSVRLPDGKPLELMTMEPKGKGDRSESSPGHKVVSF